MLQAERMILAEFGGQRKHRLHAQHSKQPRRNAAQAPLRDGRTVCHQGADHQHRQIHQRQFGHTRYRKRSSPGELADRPSPRMPSAQLAQEREPAGSVDGEKPDCREQRRGDVCDGNGNQASRRHDRNQLTELRDRHGPVLYPHRTAVEPASPIQGRHRIGWQGRERTGGRHDKGDVEIRHVLESQHRGRTNQPRADQQQDYRSPQQPQIDSQHRRVERCGASVAISDRAE